MSLRPIFAEAGRVCGSRMTSLQKMRNFRDAGQGPDTEKADGASTPSALAIHSRQQLSVSSRPRGR